MPNKEAVESTDEAHGEDWTAEVSETFEEVVTTGRPVILTRSRQTRPGKEGHFQISADPIFDENLEITSVVVTSREITEQVKHFIGHAIIRSDISVAVVLLNFLFA